MIIIKGQRLYLREITNDRDDFRLIHNILKDSSIMYAWEHGFSISQTNDFIERNLKRYNTQGVGYLMVFNKDNQFIGLIGPLLEDVNNKKHYGIGYILDKKYLGKGYATEGSLMCIDYIFDTFHTDKIVALIKEDNIPSIEVAKRLNMKYEQTIKKVYRDKIMPHHVFSIIR